MFKFLIAASLVLAGCISEVETESIPPQDPGQDPLTGVCKYNLVDEHFGECYLTYCVEGIETVEFKPNGWWCLNDHPDVPTEGTCNGHGSCLSE